MMENIRNNEIINNEFLFMDIITSSYDVNRLDIQYIRDSNILIKYDIMQLINIKKILDKHNIKNVMDLKVCENSNIIITINYYTSNDNIIYFTNRLIDNYRGKLKTWNISIKSNILFE